MTTSATIAAITSTPRPMKPAITAEPAPALDRGLVTDELVEERALDADSGPL